MPDIRKLARPTTDIEIRLPGDDEPLKLTFRRGAYSPRLLSEMAGYDDLRAFERGALLARVLVRLIADWNLKAGKQIVPITEESLADLDMGLLDDIFSGIVAEMSPTPAEGDEAPPQTGETSANG